MGRKGSKILPGIMQLPLMFEGDSDLNQTGKGASVISVQEQESVNVCPHASAFCSAPKVVVPVETTFDVSQGLRAVKMFWNEQHVPVEVVFDCHHLELANEYVSSRDLTIFEPQEAYLLEKGGLLNTSVFFNLLRCCITLQAWSEALQQQTGQPSLKNMTFEAPRPKTRLRYLWDHLGMQPYIPGKTPLVSSFQSRYITPILWVDQTNEAVVIGKFMTWTAYIADRLGDALRADLVMLTTEVTSNLLKYGFRGFYGVSIWKSGQVEVMWSNPIDHLKDWPQDDTATGLINSLQSGTKGGAGMAYIYNQLLPQYNGVLAINCKGNDLIVHSSGRYSLQSQSSRDRNQFLPNSILFTLQLFSPETRDKS